MKAITLLSVIASTLALIYASPVDSDGVVYVTVTVPAEAPSTLSETPTQTMASPSLPSPTTSPAAGSFTGEATYYDATVGMGSCGIPLPGSNVVAMNWQQYQPEFCGKCVMIQGSLGSAKAQVIDKCPGCKSGDLDLHEPLFRQVDDPAKGRVKITWSFVEC
jgi:expansin (peptidoglycan-binding protein)